MGRLCYWTGVLYPPCIQRCVTDLIRTGGPLCTGGPRLFSHVLERQLLSALYFEGVIPTSLRNVRAIPDVRLENRTGDPGRSTSGPGSKLLGTADRWRRAARPFHAQMMRRVPACWKYDSPMTSIKSRAGRSSRAQQCWLFRRQSMGARLIRMQRGRRTCPIQLQLGLTVHAWP